MLMIWRSDALQPSERPAAAPLAAALATAPAVAAFATPTPPVARSYTHTAELLSTAALPATTARTVCNPCDPKIPAMVGD